MESYKGNYSIPSKDIQVNDYYTPALNFLPYV